MGRPRQQRAPRQHVGKAGRKSGGRFGSKNVHATSTEEFDDDIDKFHKGADKISLDVNNDLELSEEDMEEPVFDLQAKSSSEEDDDDEGSDDDDLDEEQLSGLAAKMAKQAKIFRQKTSLLEDEEEDEAEEDQEGRNEKKAPWGKRKKMYYDADNVDYELYSSDEEAPAEEEAEALRLQRLIAEKLRPEDFGLDEDEEEEDGEKSLDENERSLEEVVKKSEAKTSEEAKNALSKTRHVGVSTKDANILVEEVEKDVSALSKEEQMNVVMSDAPELVGLLAELREGLDELHNKIEPVLVKVKECSHANKGGLRFLETKRMLLLCYSQSILFYLLMKAEGRSVRDHPVIARLVEIRTFLQKLQPIEKKLQNQMDKLLTSSIEYLPPSNVEAHDNSKPSIQCPVTSPKREEKVQANDASLLEREEKLQANDASLPERKRHGSSPAKISEIKSNTETQAPTNTLRQGKPRAIVHSDEDDALPDTNSLHRIISTKIQKRKPVISGDMDLPLKEGLGQRRAKLEMRKVPYHADRGDSDEQEDLALDEDEFYQEAKRLKVAKQAAKEKNSTKIILQEPIVEEEVGKRHISYQMEKNKGLTPHRKKLTKNPRKKYKLKHQKAVIRRKGQVREIKRPSGSYGGEATGIRTTISRSVRFS